jgi:DNA topoisomerase-2
LKTKKKYVQVFRQNMTVRQDPKISVYSGNSDYTWITFSPDLSRFHMERLDDDIVSLITKRVYDIAGASSNGQGKLKVYLNEKLISVSNFEQYLGLYKGIDPPVVFEKVNERWEVGVGMTDGSFHQVSFVNSICTVKGGQHVNYIVDQVAKCLIVAVKKKCKTELKTGQIKKY